MKYLSLIIVLCLALCGVKAQTYYKKISTGAGIYGLKYNDHAFTASINYYGKPTNTIECFDPAGNKRWQKKLDINSLMAVSLGSGLEVLDSTHFYWYGRTNVYSPDPSSIIFPLFISFDLCVNPIKKIAYISDSTNVFFSSVADKDYIYMEAQIGTEYKTAIWKLNNDGTFIKGQAHFEEEWDYITPCADTSFLLGYGSYWLHAPNDSLLMLSIPGMSKINKKSLNKIWGSTKSLFAYKSLGWTAYSHQLDANKYGTIAIQDDGVKYNHLSYIAYDANTGNILYEKIITDTTSDLIGNQTIALPNEHLILAYASTKNISNRYGPLTIEELDTGGNIINKKTYNPFSMNVISMTVSPSGKIIVGVNDASNSAVYLLKFNSDLTTSNFIPSDSFKYSWPCASQVTDDTYDLYSADTVSVEKYVTGSNTNTSVSLPPSKEIKQYTLSIFPNPTKNEATIILPPHKQGDVLKLQHINGIAIKRIPLDGIQTQITVQLEYLPAGIYIVDITSKDGTIFSGKVVKE